MRFLAAVFMAVFMAAAAAPADAEPFWVPGEILVAFNTPDLRAQRRVFAAVGARELPQEALPGFFMAAAVPAGMEARIAERLRRHRLVRHAEPNYILRASSIPNDPLYELQWHFHMINMEEAWQAATGRGVIVAVVDSGVSAGPDGFGDRLLPGFNCFLRRTAFWHDGNGHGTHVSGTIAQETNNNIGGAGVAYDAWILPVKALRDNGFGSVRSVVRGIVWAVDEGADIINLSLGMQGSSQFLEEAVLYAYDNKVTLVAAAGNMGRSPVDYPAAFETVIAVGAVDGAGLRVGYSNYGPEIDLVAPGGNTSVDSDADGWVDGVLQETIAARRGFFRPPVFQWEYEWDYFFFQGTSMAAPHVAGVAALIKELNPTWGPDEIKVALVETATDLYPPGRDEFHGYGLLNAGAAVAYEQNR